MININKNQIIIAFIVIIICIVIAIYILSLNQQNFNNYEDLEITDTEEIVEEPEEKEKIKVHIAGSVVSEGIVELEEGARVADAIDQAGGTTADANMDQVNLAYKVQDGQKIYIPNINEEEYEITEDMEGIQNIYETNPDIININTATQTELELLPGIGPSTASKIIKYREENGEFKVIDDIKNVSGIGDAKFESIKNQITV